MNPVKLHLQIFVNGVLSNQTLLIKIGFLNASFSTKSACNALSIYYQFQNIINWQCECQFQNNNNNNKLIN